jgi:hypothetical protein
MSSSWNRGLYDSNITLLNNGQSTMISERIFDKNVLSLTSNNFTPIQTESELFKLNYRLSRDTQTSYLPECDNTTPYGCMKNNGCTLFNQPNVNLSTKSLEPVGRLREKKTYRFEPLMFNPQSESHWLLNIGTLYNRYD